MKNVKFYSAPAIEFIDCENEGVLCASGDDLFGNGSFTDFEEIDW